MTLADNGAGVLPSLQARLACRAGDLTGSTAGMAPGFVQGNLAILPKELANDFLRFCQLNPRSCPVIGVSEVGDPRVPLLGNDLDLDAALIVEPPFPLPKTCDWQVLREEPLILLTPGALTATDPHAVLTTEPFIRYDRNHWGGRLADTYLRQAGIQPRDGFELDALDAIAVLVDRGLGVSLIPDWAPPWPSGLSLRKIALPNPSFVRRIGLIWRRSSTSIRLVHAFLDQAANARRTGRHITAGSEAATPDGSAQTVSPRRDAS